MPRLVVKPYHHGNLRDALLAAALPLLAQFGVAGLSLRGVAKAAGVSNTAPYRHFASKTALLEAVATEGFNRLITVCAMAVRSHPTNPKRQLEEAGIGYLAFALEQPETIQLMFGGVLDLWNCGDELKQSADAAIMSLSTIIDNGRKKGIYRQASTMDLLLAAWSMIHGYLMLVTAGLLRDLAETPQKIEHFGRMLSKTLLVGLLKR